MNDALIIANWKMNGSRLENTRLIQAILSQLPILPGVTMAVCPPTIYLQQLSEALIGRPLALGAQNLSQHSNGAYTGETSAAMLNDLKVRYVLVGHSERRSLQGETDQQVADKFITALDGGLIPVLCVGESYDQRRDGMIETVIGRQLDAVISRVGATKLAKGVVAYEPVWAIGTGLTASPLQAQEVHQFIRQQLAGHDAAAAQDLKILYGGSVKPDNARELLSQPDIDGALVGGAALDARSFVRICMAASQP